MATLITLEPTTLNETIRCALKTFILTLKIATFRVGEAQVSNLRTTHSSVLNTAATRYKLGRAAFSGILGFKT